MSRFWCVGGDVDDDDPCEVHMPIPDFDESAIHAVELVCRLKNLAYCPMRKGLFEPRVRNFFTMRDVDGDVGHDAQWSFSRGELSFSAPYVS